MGCVDMSDIKLKCRKCRLELLSSTISPILTVHSDNLSKEHVYRAYPLSDCPTNVDSFYFQEEGLPEWIVKLINEKDWMKGKLLCPGCSSRLGSFDFVSGQRCPCTKCVVPPVHIVKSKVDCTFNYEVPPEGCSVET